MKILLVSPSMQAGGAERVLTLLAASLAERGHEVVLVAPPGPRDADLADVPHVRVALDDRGRTVSGAMRAPVELARIVHRVQPDLIHAQNPRVAAITGVAARLSRLRGRAPVLATFHGVLPSEYTRVARLLRLADHVACVSNDLRDGLIAAGLPSARISVIYNAVEPAEPLSAELRAALDAELGLQGAPVAAIVARIVPQKVHVRFLRAALVASRQVPSARFLVIGEGPLRVQTEAAARAAGLADSVLFTGVRDDARELIARAEVVVFSSDWEGLSIAALEAMASGTPVLSTDVHGMRELLTDGAGEVVALDDGTLLGERLADLLKDSPRRAAMGAAGIELIETKYSVPAMTDAYERRYRQLIDS